jgi:hypothetical protein
VKKSRDDFGRLATLDMPSIGKVSVENAAGNPGAAMAAARTMGESAGSAMQASMASISGTMNAFGNRMAMVTDRMGGTIVRLSRRLDSTMKLNAARASIADFKNFGVKSFHVVGASGTAAFMTVDAAVKTIGAGAKLAWPHIQSLVDRMSASSVQAFKAMGIAFEAFGQTAEGVIAAFRSRWVTGALTAAAAVGKIGVAFLRIPLAIGAATSAFVRFAATTWNWVSSFGSVSKKSLSTLLHIPINVVSAPIQAGVAAMGSLQTATNAWGSSFKRIGINFAAALGFAGLEFGVTRFFKNMIKFASDTENATRQMAAVFGRSSSVIEKTADRLAERYGIVRNAVRQASVAFGNLFEGIGKSRGESATMAATFVELAANFAQAKNIAMDESVERLTLALAGSTRGLAQFGIRLRESQVESRAVALGFARAGEELSEQARTAAQADLIFSRLGNTQSALSRAYGDFSQSTREATGRVKNFQETIGDVLLPAFERMSAYLNAGLRAFNAYSNGVASAASRVRDALTSVIDGAAYVAVNWDLVWGMAQVKTNEFATNVFIGLDYLKNVMSAFADWAASDWLNTLRTAFAGAAFAVESAIMGMQKAIVKAVDSFYGTDTWSAIEIEWGKELNKLAGMVNKGMAGMRKVNPPQFADFGDQLRKLEADAKARFARLQKGLPAKSPLKEGVLPAIDKDAFKSKNKDKHAETVGLVEYAKKLQEGVAGKDAQAKKMVAEQEKTNKILLSRLPNRPMANRPLGGFARAAP